MCHHCKRNPIAPGKKLYCVKCARNASRYARRKRLKDQGIPTWQRYGWPSAQAYQSYFRQKMKERRTGIPSGAAPAALSDLRTSLTEIGGLPNGEGKYRQRSISK